jgi:molybdopterin-guanine dinucleotide biosynthesis protein A
MEVAVVLAGGPPDELVDGHPEAPNKAFLPIAGSALVTRTIAPLRATPRIRRIIVVAPTAAKDSPALAGADEVRGDGPSITKSLRSGIDGLDPDELVLITTADLPVLSGAAVDEFIDIAEASGADAVYACVERRVHLARFPQFPHTWARLRDGIYCGGGCVALRPRAFTKLEGFLERLGAARKNPLRLASIFGWDVVARYAFGMLPIRDLEKRASRLLGAKASAAICSHPEIAINVDRPSDVVLAERLFTSSE